MATFDQALAQTLTTLGVAAVVAGGLFLLVRWARRGGRGTFVAAALFGLSFLPDPVFERIIRTVQEAREEEQEEDDSGAPPA